LLVKLLKNLQKPPFYFLIQISPHYTNPHRVCQVKFSPFFIAINKRLMGIDIKNRFFPDIFFESDIKYRGPKI